MLQMTAAIILLVVATTGCATMQDNPKASIAAIAGAVLGGALLGGFAGNALDQRDKRLAAEAQQRALESAPTGTPVAWKNPDNGHAGTVTPERTYQSGGTYCREFQSHVTVDGKPDRAYGTACRQPDGSWKVQG
jgi:surface antigen